MVFVVSAAVAFMLCAVRAGPAAAESTLSHSQATAQLRAAGITWSSSGNCADRNNPTCTSFDRIRPATIKGVRTLRSASGCPINLNGGTETGHATGPYSHWNGYKVDMSPNPCLDAYITRVYRWLGYAPGWGHQFQARSGNLYVDEQTHWDVVYYTCGCRG